MNNAYIESFNGSFRAECLNAHWFMNHDDAQEKLEDWRVNDGTVRPHCYIGDNEPISLMNRSLEIMASCALSLEKSKNRCY